MRGFPLLVTLLISLLVWGVEMEEAEDYLLFTGRNYQLRQFKTKGTFEFLIRDKEGNFRPIHRPGGESPWFGYNTARGEVSSSKNSPNILDVKRWKEGFQIYLLTLLEEDAFYEGNFFITDDFLLLRSSIRAEKEERRSIVRLAPRFEVDIELFNHFAFSLPEETIWGLAKELGRPGYAGVGGWGGPKSYGSLDPTTPFFALYNPHLKTGFLFLYPFYERLWKGKHIFLQLWVEGINYFYAGWGEEKDLGKEVLFAIAPLDVFSPKEIAEEARKLNQEIEKKVREGEVPFPSLLRVLEVEEKIKRNWHTCQELVDGLFSRLNGPKAREIKKWKDNIFEIQRFYIYSKIALERGDYENALLYSEKMLKTLGKE